jgi:glycerate dehydrogenase
MISETLQRIVVLDGYCTNPGDLDWSALRALGDVELHDRTPPDQLLVRARDAQALLVNKVALTREVLATLPALRYVGVLATGYNIVDVEAARERGIVVTNIPTYGTHSVAQHAIALLLHLTNQVALHDTAVRAGEWGAQPDWSYAKTPLVELAGRTFGVIGFGRIGRQTARLAHALGMRILAYSDAMDGPGEEFPFTWISLKGLLEESDVVSLHCPLTDDTRGIINAQTLRRMKRTAVLLNTSRGPLVDEAALAEVLNSGGIAGAGVDVLRDEPPTQGSPLLTAKNCVVTPHIAWATREARERLLGIAVDNLRAWVEGRPQNVVS